LLAVLHKIIQYSIQACAVKPSNLIDFLIIPKGRCDKIPSYTGLIYVGNYLKAALNLMPIVKAALNLMPIVIKAAQTPRGDLNI
jgi:hypothetical protein